MAHAESFLVDTALNNTAFRALDKNMNTADAYSKEYDIKNTFTTILNADSDISCLLVYSSPNDLYLSEFGTMAVSSTVDRTLLKKEIQTKVVNLLSSGPLDTGNWFAMKIYERQFWVRVVRYHAVYCVCLIDLNQLVNVKTTSYNLIGPVALLYNGKTLAQGIQTDGDNIQWDENKKTYFLIGGLKKQYLIIQQPVNKLSVAYLLPYKGTLRSLNIFQILFIVFSLLVVISVPFTWWYLRRHFFRPLNTLVDTMEKIKKGNWTAQPDDDYKSLEFQQVNDTFNSMIQEITNLKIDSYENQLLIERAELDALKMQIRPHFFFNCLKSLYALAEAKRTADIQKTILKLSNHLRYVFASATDTVPLEKELQLCQN
jgi:two-component system sensor histidine kinase YesM